MTVALYAGSFDPITYGHLDILKKSLQIFDRIIVGVAYNPEKQGFLSIEDRVNLIKNCVSEIPNIDVYSYNGLTVNFAKEHNARVLIRGLRNSLDFEYEIQLAEINSTLNENIETVFLIPNPKYSFISSSCVRELVSQKGDLANFVPDLVADFLYKKYYSSH